MNAYIWIQLRCLFNKGLSIHTREYATPHPQRCGSSGAMTRQRRARRETDSRKRWLFFGSRHVYRAAIAFLILFLLNPAGAAAWFTAAEPCTDNFQLTKAGHTSGTKKYSYTWKGTCLHPCAESETYSSAKVEASYDGAKQKAAEELKFTAGSPCKIQITMTGCLYNPFIDFPPPINEIPDGCGNRLVAVSGCDNAYSLVPDSGFITEGMVPKNVTYSSGGSPPPPPPPRPPGAYEVKRIVSPEGVIPSHYTEITFALEPRFSNWPPNRIKAHWELAPENMNQQSEMQLKKGTGGRPKPTVGWNYYEKVPTDWDEFPRKFPISFFPSRKETYRVRVFAEMPDGKWIGPTEWSYFSFASPIHKSQNQFPQPPPPMPDLIVEDFIPWSQTSWQGKKGWRLRWKFKNVGKIPAIEPKYRIECDVIEGSNAYEAMCTEFEGPRTLPGNLLPDQTVDSPATDIVYEPDSEELFFLKITAIIDPDDEISEGVLGEANNELGSFITNIPLKAQQKSDDFPVQTQASNQYANKEAKVMTGKGEEKGYDKLKKGGGFVPKSDEKTMQTKQGESSLEPEGLQAHKIQGSKTIIKGGKMESRSGNVKLFDGSGPLQQDPGGAPVLKIIKPHELQVITTDDAFHIITKTLPGFETGTRVHFERQEEIPKKIGGVAIPDKGATHWWETVLVGNWGLPFNSIRVEVDNLGGPGFYRVRVMGLKHGGNENIGGWTPWRYFCIGSNENCPMTLKKAKVVEKQVTELKKGGGFVPRTGAKSIQGISPSVTASTPTRTKGADKRKMTSSSTIAQKTKVKSGVATIQTPKPNIVVQSIVYTVPQGRKAGEPFKEGEGTILSISFRNKGKAKSSKNHKYTISCIVKSGGPECPVKNETKSIAKAIKPNDTALVLLSVALKKAGEYDVTVKVTGERSVSQKTVKLKVIKKLQIQPKSKKLQIQPKSKRKTMRAVPVTK